MGQFAILFEDRFLSYSTTIPPYRNLIRPSQLTFHPFPRSPRCALNRPLPLLQMPSRNLGAPSPLSQVLLLNP